MSQRLHELTGPQAAYVVSRSNGESMTVSATRAGVSLSTVKRWDNRSEMEELAQDLRLNRALLALHVLDEAAEDAARALVDIMRDGDTDATRLRAADSVLDRTLGKAQQRLDVTTGGDAVKLYATVTPDDWDDDADA